MSTHYGSLTVVDSTFTDNTADRYGGALYTGETDGDQGTEVVIQGSTISGNQAGLGSGGFATYAARGSVLIQSSTISDNEAATNGGGLGFATYQVGGVTIEDSTVSGNQAGGSGGGINLGYVSDPVVIENSTFSGTRPRATAAAIKTRTATTPRARSATRRSRQLGRRRRRRRSSPTPTTARRSGRRHATVSRARSSPATRRRRPESRRRSRPMNAGELGEFVVGFSLVGDTRATRQSTSRRRGSNLLGVDPQLGPLADNGGPTQTLLPEPDQPGDRRRGRQRPGHRPARPAAHLRPGLRSRTTTGSDGTDIGVDRAAGGRERPARKRRLPGSGGALEDRHRGRRDDHRHRGL